MDNVENFISLHNTKISKLIKKKKRFYFDVKNDDVREIADYLFNKIGCRLSTATAQETYNGIEVLYHFSHDESGQYFCPRVVITDKKNPEMNSITPIVKGAEWIEREMYDLWGINFVGHPRLELLLTKDNPAGIKQPLRFRRES
jgi:NADH-quinone oxidoreductase subunit C